MPAWYDRRTVNSYPYVRTTLNIAVFIVVLNGIAIYTFLNKKTIDEISLKNNETVSRDSEQTNGVKQKREINLRNVPTPALLAIHASNEVFHSRKLLNSTVTEESDGDYPDDLFTLAQRKNGAIVLHIIGICYMFLALALVCDEFFVPALHVISRILKISDDVAGATFMAAGGSAPELFISVIGVFISKSNVGFGTIVGSAVFNVLFVIGMCAMFSKILLHLTWWPLLRDSLFYILALIMLISFFQDNFVEWWEALILFCIYIAYVTFMIFNEHIERKVKRYFAHATKSSSSVTPLQEKHNEALFSLSPNSFRHGALQLVLHTLDPIAEVTVQHKFQNIRHHCDDQRKESNGFLQITTDNNCSSPSNELTRSHSEESELVNEKLRANHTNTIENANEILKELDAIYKETEMIHSNQKQDFTAETANQGNLQNANQGKLQNGVSTHTLSNESIKRETIPDDEEAVQMASELSLKDHVDFTTRRFSRSSSRASLRSHRGIAPTQQRPIDTGDEVDNADEDDEPVDLSWPDSHWSRLFYVIKFPLLILLVFTLPDVRRPNFWKFFPLTFVGSIMWIAGFTYLMVWWAKEVGDFAGITDEVMGLTFLAAGTSIPDLITSVVVARQGLGDMAVSSSIGSNIFDVTVGLPLPWLIKSLINGGAAVNVTSDGLFCSTILLFIMLLCVVVTIALSRWKMTKLLGGTMFFLYVVFITITLLIQLNDWPCPIG